MIGLDPLAPPLSAPWARVVSCVILEATREARSSRVILRARYAREALAAGCGPVWRSLIRDAHAGEAIPILCFTDDCATLLGGIPSPQGPWRVREDQSFTGFSRANVELNFLPFINLKKFIIKFISCVPGTPLVLKSGCFCFAIFFLSSNFL